MDVGAIILWVLGAGLSIALAVPKSRKFILHPFLKDEIKNDLRSFERLIEEGTWRKENIEDKEIWVYTKDNTLQIEIGQSEREFSEGWTRVYPDKMGSWLHHVYLKIGGTVVKQISFVSCDGGRIFVAMPTLEMVEDERVFMWNKRSLEFKLTKLIGVLYRYKSIEEVATMSKIKIV